MATRTRRTQKNPNQFLVSLIECKKALHAFPKRPINVYHLAFRRFARGHFSDATQFDTAWWTNERYANEN